MKKRLKKTYRMIDLLNKGIVKREFYSVYQIMKMYDIKKGAAYSLLRDLEKIEFINVEKQEDGRFNFYLNC